MQDKIDIHGVEARCDSSIDKFKADRSINGKNKELILKFVDDCKTGRTLKGRAKKKIGKARILKYLYVLKTVSGWLGKPFDEAKPDEIEKLISDLEENVYKKVKGTKCFSEETKLDFKKILRKFYNWLGRGELVEFMDMFIKPKDVPAITREEVEKLLNSTPDYCLKAAIMVLFDGGMRAEELLNIRLRDLTKKKNENDTESYWVDIRFSKTEARNIPLPLCNNCLNEWLTEHPNINYPEAQLFPLSYGRLNSKISSLAEKVLKKRITLHTMRHSSATYWASKMNRYQFCTKYGWSFKSNMPDRYIKRKGIIFDRIAEKGDTDQVNKLQKENRQLIEKVENLEGEYKKLRNALEFIMELVEDVGEEELKGHLLKKRKEQLMGAQGGYYLTSQND